MKLLVVSVGRPRGSIAEAIAGFEERASHYWKMEARVVGSGAGSRREPRAVREAEAERLLPQLPEGGEVVVLTRRGKPISSEGLAKLLGSLAVRSTPSVTFVVGGAFGLDDLVLDRATRRMSLSSLTLPHDLARLVLAEQLYRAGTILRKEPYHKGTGV